jgi:hypothetical protein
MTGIARTDVWLQGVAMAALLITCVLLVRLTAVVGQLSDTLEKNSTNLAQVLTTAARISARVDGMETDLNRWTNSFLGAEGLRAVDELKTVSRALDGAGPPEGAEREITRLLAAVGSSGLQCCAGDAEYSALRLSLQLTAKYRAYRNAIGSAEEFVDRVATATVGGTPYSVVASDRSVRPLNEWLRERLAKMRAEGARE